MSRHGYQDDLDQQDLAMWRGRVASAIRGRRGQKLIRDLAVALDAMPVRRLISGDLVRDGECCALGAVGLHRRVLGIEDIAPEDHHVIANALDIAECLAREIEYENDDGVWVPETPEQRWARMRAWCARELKETTP